MEGLQRLSPLLEVQEAKPPGGSKGEALALPHLAEPTATPHRGVVMRSFYQQAFYIVWAAWLTYWGVAAIRTKRTRYRESVASRLLHIVPLLVGVALLAVPRIAGSWLMLRFLPPSPAWFLFGLVLTILGLAVSVYARVWLGRNWSGIVTLKQDHELIRGGPYRRVRHPIYTGILLAVLGSALAEGQWRALLALVLITAAFLRKIKVEERVLTEQFGDAYRQYQAEVSALLPGVY
jgi:protein-S-isoprenylcysteine O-methyltransferase Ste14